MKIPPRLLIPFFAGLMMICGACQRGITKAPYEAAATTLDGKPWRLGDYRGKVVLLVFWSPLNGTMRLFAKQLAWLQENFGARPDFAIVGVPIESSPERVRDYCSGAGMTWLELSPQANLRKSPLRDFPMNMDPEMYLIHRDGSVELLNADRFREQVEGSLFGLTYNSERIIRERLKPGMAKPEVLAIVGRQPDETTTETANEVWDYRVQNAEKSRELRVHYNFNGRGRYLGESRSFGYVNPARIHFIIGQRTWMEKVEPALSNLPQVAPGWIRRAELHVETFPKKEWGEWTSRGRMMIGAGDQIAPGRPIEARLAPDIYDFKLLVYDAPASLARIDSKDSFGMIMDAKPVLSITLEPAVELKPSEERTIQCE